MPVRKTSNTIRWLLRPFLVQRRQYWRVVLVCFLAASTFWLLNALNQTHTTRIDYPVEFVYDSRVLMPLHPLPTQVTLNVTGKGWHLMRRQLGVTKSEPIRLPVQNLPEATYLTSNSLAPAVRKVLRKFTLNYVATDTLNFRFDRKVSRTLQLVADTSRLRLAPGYQLASPISVMPRQVSLQGPAFLLDTLPATLPLRLSVHDIREDVNETVPLLLNQNPLITSNPIQATIRFAVRKKPAATRLPQSKR